jgi:hypothetical protein
MADPTDQYDPIFKEAGEAWRIDPLVLKALAKHEGNGDPNARGRSGEIGMTQIMPATARHLGMTDPHDPGQQIWASAKYLAEALDAEHDNPYAALAYYNGGPGWRSNPRRDPNYPSYVGGQYQKFAKADTGSMTDASPAPAPAESTPAAKAPADMTDAEWLDAQSKTYPGLAGPNAQPPPADTGKGAAVPATKPADKGEDDPFTRALNAPEKPASTSGDKAAPAEPDAFTRALNAPGEAKPAEAPADERTKALAAQDKTGAAADMGWNAATEPPPRSDAPNDPTGAAADMGYTPGDNMRSWLAPAPGTTYADVLPLAKDDKTGAIRLAMPNLLRAPLIGLTSEGPQLDPSGKLVVPGATLDPVTGTAGVSPEAGSVAALAASPLRFSGANPLQYAAPGTLDRPTPLPGVAPVSPEAAARAAERPSGPTTETGIPSQPMPAPGAPGAPQPAGAQVTPSLSAGMTPGEIAAHQKTAEGQKLMEGQVYGEPDRNEYIKGITPTAAEQEQTAVAARELKSLGQAEPKVADAAKQAEQENGRKRVEYFRDTSQGPHDLHNEEVARQTDIETAKPHVFAPANVKGPVDHVPIVNEITDILNQPANRQNSAVQSVLRPLIDKLQNADGTAKILDPEEMWGLRQEIDRMTSKRMMADDNNLHYSARQLSDVSNVIDKQIEKVAPGYDAMIAKYAEHSRNMEAMKVLQDAEPSLLRGAGQTMTFNDFQRFMRQVVKGRNTPSTDLNAFKSITPETMQRLWNLRDDLRRSASARELASAAGSDTSQNITDLIKQYTKMGAMTGVHAAANYLAPGVGSLAVTGLAATAKAIRAPLLQRRQMARGQQMIRPPNALIDPNAAP